MSGFVVGFGNPNLIELKQMFGLIEHRGPFASGIYHNKKAIMAQNYLKADGEAASGEYEIPFANPLNESLRICYDGQIGNTNNLSQKENIPKEDFILECYKQFNKSMFRHLNDAIFAFVISDGDQFLAARDLLGIKTLFYGWKDDTLYLASELKSIIILTDEVFEFPPGHYMTGDGQLTRFAELPKSPKESVNIEIDKMTQHIKTIIKRSMAEKIDYNITTGSLLSGGLDSSVICYLANLMYKEKFGPDTMLKTFSIGVGESEDIKNARIMSDYLNTDHNELIVALKNLLEVLPEVIYYLESFDPSLVRSAVSNFLVSRFAKEKGIKQLLSGEGGDEIFCGYNHLKLLTNDEVYAGQIEILDFLHNNASLRLDRMNQCNSIKVVTPLISGELLEYSLTIPTKYKIKKENGNKIEKWIFRKSFEGLLPDKILWRLKQEFSQGSGSASELTNYFEKQISHDDLRHAQGEYPFIRSKEELYYFNIFKKYFGTGRAVETVGQWISL